MKAATQSFSGKMMSQNLGNTLKNTRGGDIYLAEPSLEVETPSGIL